MKLEVRRCNTWDTIQEEVVKFKGSTRFFRLGEFGRVLKLNKYIEFILIVMIVCMYG